MYRTSNKNKKQKPRNAYKDCFTCILSFVKFVVGVREAELYLGGIFTASIFP